ncbi:hypothetical protein AYO44_02095 [Planctomycetaceae bacterium SCGC AG-212-F19]|nr:hypothetical protein AYO44_02095 [Planctomycetaceae bacterium SCGC AG-212-F19]
MLNRRDAMMRLGQLGLGAMTLPGLLGAQAAPSAPRRGKAKSCIYLFLWGGPPQQDLWDMKPDAPEGVRSLFQPIRTVVPGIDICDQMPLLAKHTDQLAVVRSVSHPSDIHEPSVYRMLTGQQDPTLVVPRNSRKRSNFPNVGSVVSYFSEPGAMPATVTVPRPIGHDGVTYAGTHAGFLGPRHDPLELKEAPNAKDHGAHAVSLPPDVDATRLIARRGLVKLIEDQERMLNNDRAAQALGGYYDQAFRMLASPVAKRAFDLNLEPPALRDRYGRNEYGDSFLLARRLVEADVRLVSVIWMYIKPDGGVANVWDNHAGFGIHGAKTGYDLLKSPVCIPTLDRAYTALLTDLADRGLLDETLIVAVGEFGRTPKINKEGGRDHWGKCQSALLAGGGIRGGQVYGSSDATAGYPKENPISPEDLLATIYHAFGIEPDREIQDREGRPHRLCDGKPLVGLFG